MQDRLPLRFWVEMLLGLMSAVLLALTIVVPDWMEALFGSAADAGDGSAERALTVAFAAGSVIMFGLARRTWRKHVLLLRSR